MPLLSQLAEGNVFLDVFCNFFFHFISLDALLSLHFYCDLRSLDTQLLTNCSVVVMTIRLNRNEEINILIKHYRFKLSFLIIFFIRSEQLFICLVPVRFGVMSELVSKRADLSAVIGMHDAVDMRKLKSFVFTSMGSLYLWICGYFYSIGWSLSSLSHPILKTVFLENVLFSMCASYLWVFVENSTTAVCFFSKLPLLTAKKIFC